MGDQRYYVVDGATLQCDKGSAPAKLKVTSQQTERLKDKLQATVQDCKPNENIMPFGTCSITKGSCSPATMPWKDPSKFVDNNGIDELLDKSTCQCTVGGKISVMDPGQKFIFETVSKDDPSNEIVEHKECHCVEDAAWMKLVLSENAKNIVESAGKRSPEIMKYYTNTPYENDLKITDSNNSWCASFVNWVMENSGMEGLKSKDAYDKTRALKWKEWQGGKVIANPVYGALAIKQRRGGGHIGFVAGTREVKGKGKKLVVIGGNQGNALKAALYAQNDFLAFVVPKDYEVCLACYELPEYSDKADNSSTES